MKLRNLMWAAVAGVALLAGCKKSENLGPADIKIDPTQLTFDKGASSQNVAITASRDWLITTDIPSWIKPSAKSGEASGEAKTISISVDANAGTDRTLDLVFSIGLKRVTLHVSQAGEQGEYKVPQITCKEFIEKADPSTEYRLVGKVASAVNASYGSFDLNDGTATVVVWNVLNKEEWAGKIEKGGTVTVRGKYQLYENNGSVKHEMVEATIEAYEAGQQASTADPKGDGSQANPFNVAAAINAVKDLTWTSNTDYQKVGPFYVSGKIGNIAKDDDYYNAQFGNATFTIVDEGFSAEFTAYRILYLGNKKWTSSDTQIKVGDEVIVCAELMNYRGNTPETVQNTGYLYSLNGVTGGDTPQPQPGNPEGDGSQTNPYNVVAAINAVKDLTWTSNTEYQKTGDVYVKGKISRIADKGTYGESGTYGNASFYITDSISEEGAPSNEFYCFRILYYNGEKYTSGTDIKVGDDVVIYGKLMNYRGNTPETVGNECCLYSLNGATGGDNPGPGPQPQPGEAEGDGSLANPYNAVAAINAVKDLTWTSNTDYQKTGDVYVKGKISRIANKGTYGESGDYGNASFYISADGTENNEFYCFRVLYFNGEKYTAGTDIAKGDDVIIYGKLMNYKGNTPETVGNESCLYSLNGATGGDDPGPGPQPQPGEAEGDGSLDNPYNAVAAINAVKDLTWTSNTDYQTTDEVYVKGFISRIASKGTYGESGDYGNASFYISADGSENNEFYCFRILYFNGEKYTAGTDIAKGDEVIVYGKLMNYKGNTPETVSGQAWLYSLNGVTEGGDPGPGPDVQEMTISVTTGENSFDATWGAIDGAEYYYWWLMDNEDNLVAEGYTEENNISTVAGEYIDEETLYVEWYVDALTNGYSYFLMVGAYVNTGDPEDLDDDDTLGFGEVDFTAQGSEVPGPGPVDPGEECTVSFSQDQLAAAACKGAKVDMDTVISFTNSTDYGTNTVTELRIYKGQTWTVSAASGYKITKIEITCTATGVNKQGPGCWGAGAPNGYSFNPDGKDGEWTGSASSVKFTATDNQVRIAALAVTYVAE